MRESKPTIEELQSVHQLMPGRLGSLVKAGLVRKGARCLTDAGKEKLKELLEAREVALAAYQERLDGQRVTVNAGALWRLLEYADSSVSANRRYAMMNGYGADVATRLSEAESAIEALVATLQATHGGIDGAQR